MKQQKEARKTKIFFIVGKNLNKTNGLVWIERIKDNMIIKNRKK